MRQPTIKTFTYFTSDLTRISKNICRTDEAMYFGKEINVNINLLNDLHIDPDSTQSYTKMIKQRCLYETYR